MFGSLSCTRTALRHAKIPWQTHFQATCVQPAGLATGPLQLMASRFAYLFEEGLTESIYAGSPVADINHYKQGKFCQAWAKRMLEMQRPESEILDPEPGTDCNGKSNSLYTAPYDFLMDGRKVEVKSSRMVWSTRGSCWLVRFNNIKLPFGRRLQASFDDLYCVILSPKGLHLVQHDLCTRVSMNGHGTEAFGYRVVVCASVQDASWEEALSTVQRKLCQEGSCKLVVESGFSDPDLLELLAGDQDSTCAPRSASHLIQMPHLSAPKRALRIQQMGLEIDRILHPRSHFRLLMNKAVDLSVRRNTSNAPVDWVRDKVKVEIKSAKLRWDKANRRWGCSFLGIKPSCFDELWLAIISPLHLRFYRCRTPDRLRLGSHGKATEVNGFQIALAGPSNEEDHLKALSAIEAKMISRGCCKLVATVHWDGALTTTPTAFFRHLHL